MAEVNTAIVELREVKKTYGKGAGAVEVLHGINLQVQKGEMVAIMGASGSGKSTLMNIIGTLDRLTSGEYLFEGERVDDFSSARLADLRNRRIGFIFQSFNLLTRLSVAQNIERPMMYGQIPRGERQGRIEAALEKVGLLEKKLVFPKQLSGGQQQRVAVARSLVMAPALILADEPTGALDSKTSAKVMGELKKINQETGMTMILVTHDDKTATYADRIIRVQDGLVRLT
jgi:putative ABC transport system ATP-binding protein